MIIGLCGYARTGKDTLAKKLENYKRVAFASKLKMEAMRMLHAASIDMDLFDERGKQEWRDFLVFWGAKRRSLDEGYWIKQLYPKIVQFQKQDERVIITDVRYLNEIEAIERWGGRVIRLIRPGYNPANEEEASSFELIDSARPELPRLINDGTPLDLAVKARQVIQSFRC